MAGTKHKRRLCCRQKIFSGNNGKRHGILLCVCMPRMCAARRQYKYMPLCTRRVRFFLYKRVFFLRVLRGLCFVSLRLRAFFFLLIRCNSFFWGGRGTSSSEALFLSRPQTPPAPPALCACRCSLYAGLVLFDVAVIWFLRVYAGCVLSACGCGFSFFCAILYL